MRSVTQTPKRTVLYARVSTDEQDKKYGPAYRRLELTSGRVQHPWGMANLVRRLTWKE
jgi:hypothetical protein